MKDKHGMEPAARQLLAEKLKHINAQDMQAIYPERGRQNNRLFNIVGLWSELCLPEIISVRDMKFNIAWDAVMYDNYNHGEQVKEAEAYLKSGKYDAVMYAKAMAEIDSKSLKLLRDGKDKNFYQLASTVWDGMNYDQRLKFVADGRQKRMRGSDPLSMLLDITDPNGNRFQQGDSSDEYKDAGNNEWLL
ncbi:MAG: hypothetical protein ACLQQ4_04730 [Bacteroidia bacterium]